MLQRSAVLMGVLTAVVGLGARPACGQQEPMPGWLDLTARWETLGPPRGTLMICGGVYHVSDFARFLALAGGPDARIVLIPTARPDYAARADFTAPHELRKAGARHVVVLHTMDRAQADSDAFVAPLREASGVWFSGGDQKHLGRVYVHTRAHTEILRLLDRGGVVGGNSAGASIQGSYLYGGGRELPDGLGLVRESVIGQHYFRRNRHDSLTSYLARRPELLGLGIGEWAGVQVRGDEMEVFGRGKVAVADASAAGWPELPYRELVAGDQYRLGARAATHQQVWAASDHWRRAHRPWPAPEEAWPTLGPPRGCVLLCAATAEARALRHFLDLAGGPRARIVVVPTASLVSEAPAAPIVEALRALGAENITVRDGLARLAAQSEAFAAILREASGVYFCHGEPWRLVEAYRHTLFHFELVELLGRGGVVAAEGDSTRALASHLFGGGYRWDRGLSLLRATAVDNRLPDGRLAEDFAGFLEEHRGLRGIALGAGARVLLAGNCTVSVGDGRAAIRERN